nr:hypothetical protein [Tanacetum cinerariifolium]
SLVIQKRVKDLQLGVESYQKQINVTKPEKLDWENPEGGDYPFDLSKPLPLITRGNRQSVPVEFFINSDLKYLQGGISTMTYTTSTTKTKAARYDLPGIKDMVPNIWSPIKVAYDKYALWGILHWREHQENVVRRANNALYKFKEESASRRAWFTKPLRPQEPTGPDWNEDKTPQKGPTQNWLMTLAAFSSTSKSLKEFNELMSTSIDLSSCILNGLKIKNLTQEILLGPAFRLLKGTRLNYAELEYDYEECYKALSEKLDWENPEGGDYPF